MAKNPERAAAHEGAALAYRTALERLMAAVRAMDLSRGSGWDQVVDALAAADAALGSSSSVQHPRRALARRSGTCAASAGLQPLCRPAIFGHTLSCGCLMKERTAASRTTRGATRGRRATKLYMTWASMLARCTNPAEPAFPNYGGRGITVCDEWRASFDAFRRDMGERPAGLTLERIDNGGPYSPANCRWASRKEQARNTRANRLITHNGVTLCLADWALRIGITTHALWQRLNAYHWPLSRALTEPLDAGRSQRRRTTQEVDHGSQC